MTRRQLHTQTGRSGGCIWLWFAHKHTHTEEASARQALGHVSFPDLLVGFCCACCIKLLGIKNAYVCVTMLPPVLQLQAEPQV